MTDAALAQMFAYGTATPPHCRDREETGVIRPNAHVRVVGLQSRGDLNGCSAVIAGDYHVQRERWPVTFDSGESVMIKASNIRVDPTQPADVPSAESWLAAHVPPGMRFTPMLPPMNSPGMPPVPTAEEFQEEARRVANAMAAYAKDRPAAVDVSDSNAAANVTEGKPLDDQAAGGFVRGDSVELKALARAELNGARGVCRVFNAGTPANPGRWEVVLWGAQKAVKIRPDNLIHVTSPRCEAVKALSTFVGAQYPERGFKLHPAVRFQADEHGGVCVRATDDIAAGDILLVVPDAIGVACRSKTEKKGASERKLPDGSPLQHVLTTMGTLWRAREDEWLGIIGLPDAQLAVLLMQLACDPLDDLDRHVATAWPSIEDVRSSMPLFWEAARLARIGGTQVSRHVMLVQEEASRVFEQVVEPALSAPGGSSGAPLASYFRKDGASLRECFLFGFSLAYSRAHDSDPSDSSIGILRPLIDQINGLPGPHAVINVEVNRGKWPFIRGNLFRDECNLAVSAVAAKRAIRAGEELIIDYGEASTSMFMLRYGIVPRQLLSKPNQNETVECLIPAELKPQPSDHLRLQAVCGIFGFTGFEDGAGFVLPMTDLAHARRGQEPDSLKSLRQLLVLLIAEPHELQAFCACNGARFRFNPSVAKLGNVMTRSFDHSLALLAPRDEEEDPMRAIERQGLRGWRDFLAAKYPSL